MKAAILCPGPSLAERFRDNALSEKSWLGDVYDFRIAINRAAIAYPCDIWAAGDIPMLDGYAANVAEAAKSLDRPLPIWFTTSNTAARSRGIGPKWLGEIVEFESLFEFLNPSLPAPGAGWTMFTATAAVVYAASRGATQVDCFGMDWKGTADFDGYDGGEPTNRNESRWSYEAGIFQSLSRALAERGHQVRRMQSTQ